MKISQFFLFACSVVMASTGSVALAAAPAAEKPAARKLVLEKGTAAEDIRKAYGAPLKIVPAASAGTDLHAETWIYRRKAAEMITQEHIGDTMETYNFTATNSGGMSAVQPVKISTPILKSKRVTTYQVTRLLIIDGRLELATVQREREESYL